MPSYSQLTPWEQVNHWESYISFMITINGSNNCDLSIIYNMICVLAEEPGQVVCLFYGCNCEAWNRGTPEVLYLMTLLDLEPRLFDACMLSSVFLNMFRNMIILR